MKSLKDSYMYRVKTGDLVFPSSISRRVSGNYYLDDDVRPTDDNQIFPALVLDSDVCKILTSSGRIASISSDSLISIEG
jgi:hypothetical protein